MPPTLDHFPLPLKIRRNARAKSMTLRLSPCGSEARLTIPKRLSERKALEFAHQQRGWLEQQLAKQSDAIAFAPGTILPLFGADCELLHDTGQRGVEYTPPLPPAGEGNGAGSAQAERSEVGGGVSPSLIKSSDASPTGNLPNHRFGDFLPPPQAGEESIAQLHIGGSLEHFPSRVERWIKQQAKQRFGELALQLARQIDERPAAVTVRDTSSRWGSCSHARRISLNWRLAFAPADVAHYVIAHEVAHLKHFDHSPAFWQVVGQLHPDYADAKNWLRRHGRALHRFGRV